jgi:ATP-dependent Clp protease ATP-binding subunit ClpC
MNGNFELNLQSRRAVKARLGRRIGKTGYRWFVISGGACMVTAAGVIIATGDHWPISLIGLGILLYLPAIWWNYDLRKVALEPGSLVGQLSGDVLGQLNPQTIYTPHSLWQQLARDLQLLYITHHLLLTPEMLEQHFSDETTQLAIVWQAASELAGQDKLIEAGHIAAALILTMPNAGALLASFKLSEADIRAVANWLNRNLTAARQPRQQFGGIGRDWANGFTPQLDHFGHNISLGIEAHNAHFGALVDSPGVQAVKAAFTQGTYAIALIGPNGIGKTSHAYALAQNLLTDTGNPRMQHQQVIALDASAIISASQRPGELEQILTLLLNEAMHAGNITLFFDDAELFFGSGPGSFNATQILLPVLQSRAVRVIFAISPHDYQQLKSTNPSFAGLLSPVVLQEPSAEKTHEILADTAATFEYRHGVLIAYDAIKEAYQLSGRYELDMAYPGKAIRLLEQALTHAEQNIVTAHSVQAAIQQSTGVKAGTAAPLEANELLHLEDRIHERMINQVRAVSVVASALRRSRAGVANPNRPIGSFLFLGPTGVGKTELAKAVAATYFGDESNMIRLDMSEYQQPTDVSRLLSGGENETSSLILKVRQQPFSVVLLDEVEKAHPNILNLLLQLLDEGQLTDNQGRRVSFKDAVIIATSNAGADAIREHIASGQQLEDFETELTNQLISSGQFRPELLNRFDEIVLFRPLNAPELAQVVRLMLAGVNQTLATQNITVTLTDAAVEKIVAVGNDPRLGARPMRRALQRAVENTVANKILSGEIGPGSNITLDAADLAMDSPRQ